MPRILLPFFILSALAPRIEAAEPQGFWSDPKKILLLGVERLAKNDFREAIPLLEAALRMEPSAASRAWLANAYHLQRRLDDAAVHYRLLLEEDPPGPLDDRRREAMLRLAPRVYQVPTDPFGLIESVAIHHPDEPLIAYHFFWEDDIDFPADNDPCDHELVWVRYEPADLRLTDLYTYFHGRILSSPLALQDAARNGGRPRVNVQWGKHGSLPFGWEELKIQADTGDVERNYLDLARPQTVRDYNLATYRKLNTAGREHRDHPRTSGWPARFEGSWEEFVRFEKEVDIRPHLAVREKLAVSRWNNAALHQNFIAYNFRPKTEWPDRPAAGAAPAGQLERRVGAGREYLFTAESSAMLRREAGSAADGFLKTLNNRTPGLPLELPALSLFQPETPRFPNVWIHASLDRFSTYDSFLEFLESHFRKAGYEAREVHLNEGADLALSIEHLQPWDGVQGLRHAHAIHIRFFWKRLFRQNLQRVPRADGPANRFFWRVAASVHYEVEHAHPLHADVEVCPYCGRTGAYSSAEGNLVELAHDPLGVELLLNGEVRGQRITTLDNIPFPPMPEFLKVRPEDVLVTRPYRPDMNTGAIAAVFLR